jgi:hypothetical protein
MYIRNIVYKMANDMVYTLYRMKKVEYRGTLPPILHQLANQELASIYNGLLNPDTRSLSDESLFESMLGLLKIRAYLKIFIKRLEDQGYSAVHLNDALNKGKQTIIAEIKEIKKSAKPKQTISFWSRFWNAPPAQLKISASDQEKLDDLDLLQKTMENSLRAQQVALEAEDEIDSLFRSIWAEKELTGNKAKDTIAFIPVLNVAVTLKKQILDNKENVSLTRLADKIEKIDKDNDEKVSQAINIKIKIG